MDDDARPGVVVRRSDAVPAGRQLRSGPAEELFRVVRGEVDAAVAPLVAEAECQKAPWSA